MSTRVQKGSTVFRPVTKARPRTHESTSTPQPPPEIEKKAPLPPVIPISPPSPVIHHAPIADTTKRGVPIAVPSPVVTPSTRTAGSRPPPSEGPSNVEIPIAAKSISQSKVRSRSGSLTCTSPKKPRKVRQSTTLDAGASPGEELDPTSVTMAALCEDTGQGRVSSKAAQILDNHLAWKKSNKEKRMKMKTLMEAKKYGRNEDGNTTRAKPDGASEQRTTTTVSPGEPSTKPTPSHLSAIEDTSGQGFDYSQNVATSRYNVQVRIGPNGETIIDEESLFVDRNAEEDATEYTHVEESDVTKFTNSATYAKRFRGSRWSAEETELFYDALSQFGENYELISYILPGRDRKACKNKFKTEDKKNPQRINYCLNNRKPYDIQILSRMTGKDFSGPTPEIRAPAALSLAEPQNKSEVSEPPAARQTVGQSSNITGDAEEVVGDVSNFDPELE